jgi:AcrR family transcriptional regulator
MTDRRTTILEAATRMIAQAGVRGLRVEQVAEQAGVSTALIYYHFGDRAGLLRQTLAFIYERADRYTSPGPDPADAHSALERVLLLELQDEESVRENSTAWGELRSTAIFETDLREQLLDATRQWIDEITLLVDKALVDKALVDKALVDRALVDKALVERAPAERGGAADADPAAIAERLTALVEGLSERWLSGSIALDRARQMLREAIAVELAAAGLLALRVLSRLLTARRWQPRGHAKFFVFRLPKFFSLDETRRIIPSGLHGSSGRHCGVHGLVVEAVGTGVVGALAQHLLRGAGSDRVGGLGDGRSQADPDHAGDSQFGHRRGSRPDHHRDRQRASRQQGERVQVDQAGHEQAVRARLGVRGGPVVHFPQVAGTAEKHIGPGVDPERLAGNGGAGRPDPFRLPGRVAQHPWTGPVLQVDSDRAGRRDGGDGLRDVRVAVLDVRRNRDVGYRHDPRDQGGDGVRVQPGSRPGPVSDAERPGDSRARRRDRRCARGGDRNGRTRVPRVRQQERISPLMQGRESQR